MKVINMILLFCLPIFAYSQEHDSLRNENWFNFDRKRSPYERNYRYLNEKLYITKDRDTLIRNITRSKETNEILQESSFHHGKKNGLEIFYFPNGVIEELDYYLDGKLWETISRSDSNGKLLNPGDVHNGNGRHFFSDYHDPDVNCYETYRNGLPEGPYYRITGTSSAVKGELTYKESAVNYLPAKRITIVDTLGRRTTEVYENKLFESIYSDITNNPNSKIITVSDDSVAEDPRNFVDLSIGFDDPAIIPKGNWIILNLENGQVVKSIDFDDNGNAIKIVAYTEKGKIFWERNYSPCSKRKLLKSNPDGSFLEEYCKMSK